jgi:hypothetical protein
MPQLVLSDILKNKHQTQKSALGETSLIGF